VPAISQNGNQLASNASSGNQWFLDGVAIAGATGQNYTPSASGNYSVQVTLNGCTSTMSATVNFTVTAVPDIDVLWNGVKLFPNPVHDKLIITHSSSPALNIRIIDISGRKIKELSSGSARSEIDMSAIANGVYIIWVEDKRNRVLGKKQVLKM
jgi:hypothetical protein